MLREEYRQRLIKEYRYAVAKMQEAQSLDKKLFYFSVIFGEAQRILNWEWNDDLVLIHLITQHLHTQINGGLQTGSIKSLPIDWTIIIDKLTQFSSDLTTYFENENENNSDLYKILKGFAEIAYVVTGNGSYLYEKGAFNL